MCFGELHVELLGGDLSFFGSVDALPQLRGLLVMMLIEGKQVDDHVLDGGVIFLTLQGFHASNLG